MDPAWGWECADWSYCNTEWNLDVRSPNRSIYTYSSNSEALYALSGIGNGIYSNGGENGIYSNGGDNGIYSYGGNFGIFCQGGTGGSLSEGPYIGAQGTATGSNVDRQAVRGELNTMVAGGYAGLFTGTTWIAGTLIKNAGAFMIDHPIDPDNKYLMHSFVESPDMKNIYDGVIITDENGIAEVELPNWFQTLNIDYRYQLTCINQYAETYVSREIADNNFQITTGKPFIKISWQVTGIRNDPYARDNRLPVEKDKTGQDVGKYIYPQGFNKSETMRLAILNHQEKALIHKAK
ncbi:MAG: hypothetical protein IPL46_30610 [Saprospiraceae bacterium]|nr:hypothetical protein [Saprospiraceae bacterium]